MCVSYRDLILSTKERFCPKFRKVYPIKSHESPIKVPLESGERPIKVAFKSQKKVALESHQSRMVPPNHLFVDGIFPELNHPASPWGYPHGELETPRCKDHVRFRRPKRLGRRRVGGSRGDCQQISAGKRWYQENPGKTHDFH